MSSSRGSSAPLVSQARSSHNSCRVRFGLASVAALSATKGVVAHTGFEPVISALRGRCPWPLDECATCLYVKVGVAGDRGFEPRLTEPESVVLPLDESPVCPNSSSETHFLQGCRGHRCSTFVADDWPWDSTEFDRGGPGERREERRSGYIFSQVRIRSRNRDRRQAWRVDLPH